MISMDFSGKNYIVTGGAGSIGRAITEGILENGGCVWAVDNDEAGLNEMAGYLPSKRFHACCADLSDSLRIRSLMEHILSEAGQLHGFVSCVGILSTTAFTELTQEEWDKVLNINLTGVFAAVQPCFNHMCTNRYGRIVIVSSIAGKVGGGFTGRGAYATGKAGLNCLTKVMAKEGGPFNVCCNAVCPGWTDSRMINHLMTEESEARSRGTVALGRKASPAEAANPVLFYLSDLASFMTGEIADVDGGCLFD